MIYHVYGKNNCGYCSRAKNLLRSRNEQFFYHDISKDEAAMKYVKETLQARTVPQVISEDAGQFTHIGGYTELAAHFEENDMFNDM